MNQFAARLPTGQACCNLQPHAAEDLDHTGGKAVRNTVIGEFSPQQIELQIFRRFGEKTPTPVT